MRAIRQKALISLGSNDKSIFGDPRETVQKAMSLVAELSEQTAQLGRLYSTPAFPAGAGPDFVNAAMAISTTGAAPELLQDLHRIEALANRIRTARWGQRTLDLDLIAMEAEVHPDAATQTKWRDLPLAEQQTLTPSTLILPHPRVQDRAFVLIPMLDVAPDWVHPVTRKTIVQMAADLPSRQRDEVQVLEAS